MATIRQVFHTHRWCGHGRIYSALKAMTVLHQLILIGILAALVMLLTSMYVGHGSGQPTDPWAAIRK